jgi:hypothetical protein
LPTQSGCPGETVSLDSVNASGTVTFNGDGTYSSALTFSFHESAVVPTACLTRGTGSGDAGAVTLTCTQLATAFQNSVTSDAGAATASCTQTSTGCQCTVTAPGQPSDSTGTFTTSGNTFTTTSSDAGPGTPSSYCVSGNTLTVSQQNNADAGSSGPSLAITLTK